MTLEWYKSEAEMKAYRIPPDTYVEKMVKPVLDALEVSSHTSKELERKTFTDADGVIKFTLSYEVALGS